MLNLCDYMIIQRDSDGFGRVEFSGTVREPEKETLVVVRVMREDDNMTVLPWQPTEVVDGKWMISLTVPAGGLYRVEARGACGEFDPFNNRYDWMNTVGLARHVGVGDVFLLAGQSNMSAYGKDFAFDPPQLGVHMFTNDGKWDIASHPLNTSVNSIYPNNDLNSGTSPGLAFGRMMAKHLGVPVGLVSDARGGSMLEDWNPDVPEECVLYHAMVDKAEKVGKISAIIWYQGCSDANTLEDATQYLARFNSAVNHWRKAVGNVPIISCQMNRHAYKGGGDDRYWGILREAQRQSGKQIDDLFVVPSLDMPTCDGIHNTSGACVMMGERIANVLLHGVYQKVGSFAPDITEVARVDDTHIVLHFANDCSLRTCDDNANGINVEDDDGLMNCTEVVALGNKALVTTERKIGNNAVFHAYWRREVPAFFLRDAYGMPMLACYGVPIK